MVNVLYCSQSLENHLRTSKGQSLSTEAIVSVSANKDAVDKDAVEELLANVSQHCANSGLVHF